MRSLCVNVRVCVNVNVNVNVCECVCVCAELKSNCATAWMCGSMCIIGQMLFGGSRRKGGACAWGRHPC